MKKFLKRIRIFFRLKIEETIVRPAKAIFQLDTLWAVLVAIWVTLIVSLVIHYKVYILNIMIVVFGILGIFIIMFLIYSFFKWLWDNWKKAGELVDKEI